MARATGSDKLVCSHTGGWRWVDFELMRASGGYAIIAPCALGDHFLAPTDQGRYVVGLTPHYFASAVEATGARDAWRIQEGQR